VHVSGAAEELAALQESFGLPVATTVMGKGAVDENYPLSAGIFGYFMTNRSRAKHLRPMVASISAFSTFSGFLWLALFKRRSIAFVRAGDDSQNGRRRHTLLRSRLVSLLDTPSIIRTSRRTLSNSDSVDVRILATRSQLPLVVCSE